MASKGRERETDREGERSLTVAAWHFNSIKKCRVSVRQDAAKPKAEVLRQLAADVADIRRRHEALSVAN